MPPPPGTLTVTSPAPLLPLPLCHGCHGWGWGCGRPVWPCSQHCPETCRVLRGCELSPSQHGQQHITFAVEPQSQFAASPAFSFSPSRLELQLSSASGIPLMSAKQVALGCPSLLMLAVRPQLRSSSSCPTPIPRQPGLLLVFSSVHLTHETVISRQPVPK